MILCKGLSEMKGMPDRVFQVSITLQVLNFERLGIPRGILWTTW